MNHLCAIVGLGDNNGGRDSPPPRGEGGNWDMLSHQSGLSHQGSNLLAGIDRGQQRGGWDHQGHNQRGGQPPGGGQGGIPGAINNDNVLEIQSHVSNGGDFNQGTVKGGQGQQPGGGLAQHAVRPEPGGGIRARIEAATSRRNDATIEKDLNWQGRVEGNATRIAAFQDQALNQHTFRAFAFMKGKSPVVHMAHSMGQFFGMLGLALNVQGKQIGFIGDWGNGRHPVPFILPPQNSWAWLKTKYLQNTASFIAYYNNKANRDKLWATGTQDNKLTEAPLPRLVALPTFVVEFLGKHGGSCLPHKLQKFVEDYLDGGEC
jgi:hypothetical protein